ncbi:antibiotic biosynthesis monooxygenase [Serratia marcescens]|nr:antibiotic biosynthesis monooxygenase [Serratia marcescens]
MIVIVFRLRPNLELAAEKIKEYKDLDSRMDKLVIGMPGYISHKSFKSTDDEEVVIIEFESEETLHAWSVHPEHVSVKKNASLYFSEYRIQVCSILRDTADSKPKCNR